MARESQLYLHICKTAFSSSWVGAVRNAGVNPAVCAHCSPGKHGVPPAERPAADPAAGWRGAAPLPVPGEPWLMMGFKGFMVSENFHVALTLRIWGCSVTYSRAEVRYCGMRATSHP